MNAATPLLDSSLPLDTRVYIAPAVDKDKSESGTRSMTPAHEAIKHERRGASFWQQLLLCHVRSLKVQHEKLGKRSSLIVSCVMNSGIRCLVLGERYRMLGWSADGFGWGLKLPRRVH